MERTTIMIPEELKIKVKRQAGRRGISLAQFIRESLEFSLEKLEKENQDDDSFISDVTVYYGDAPNDISENHDKYLYGD